MKRLKCWISRLLIACLFLMMAPEAFAAEDRAMGGAGVEKEQHGVQIFPQDHADPPTAFGIDVSHHQGTIDWDAVAPQIDFAIIRCGYGDDITSQDDRQWHRNVQECTRLGIPFGVYIYSYALSEEEAVSEANHVLRLLEGYRPTLPVYYDLEDDSILKHCESDQILNIARIFCDKIEAAGYRAGIYANYNWWTNYLTAGEYDRWDRWIARYADATGYGGDYTIWQYSAAGEIEGISEKVDMNHWYGPFPPAGIPSSPPANPGDVFTAPVLNGQHGKILENRDGIVRTADETGTAEQLWKFERQADGSYIISSCRDGRCLTASEGQVVVAERSETNDQRWNLYEASGGYVLNAKCTDCVLTLTGNDSAGGAPLQMDIRNDTAAQVWTILLGEEYTLQAPSLSVDPGSSATATAFTWNEVYGECCYDIKIWKDTLGEGDADHTQWDAVSGWSVVLPAGTYHARVEARNYFELKMSNVVTFTVNPATYTISYDANGGDGAPPAQIKTHNVDLVLSAAVPTRTGYTFLGWAVFPDAKEASYQPGSSYTDNGDQILYAVWEYNCRQGHTYIGTVSRIPSLTADGTLVGTCSGCADITAVVLPVLNAADYTYTVIEAADCTAEGTGCYTWKNTDYGSFSFDVTIPATGHAYADGDCIRCGAGDPDYFTEIATGWSGSTTWVLRDDGTIIFSGSGNMKNYGYDGGQPWLVYADQIKSVIVREGVSAVGTGAFMGLTRLETVTLPGNSLSKIGEAAFYGCTNLREITIPESIYTVWAYTFKNCTSLESVSLPRNLIKIDQGAFENCIALPFVEIPTDVNIVGFWSFKGCTNLAEVDMTRANVTEIREGAFKNCTGLTTIHLPANIQVLGDSCFYGIGAVSFDVPATVTTVGSWCFARAYSLKEICFEGNAPAIGEGAFNKITLTAYYPGNNATWKPAVMQNYGGTTTWAEK